MFVGTGKPRKPSARAAARILRANGWSYKKIAIELAISPSSAFHWTRDIKLTQQQVDFNNGKGLTADSNLVNTRAQSWVRKNKERRLAYQREGRERAREGFPLHHAGCMLYWAEGAKQKNSLTLANSDINMVAYFLRFLRECFEIPNDVLTIRLNVYLGNGHSVREIEERWLSALTLPRSCLRKHQIDHFPTSSSGKKKTLPFGVCTLRVLRSTWLTQHIFGAIQEYGGFDEPKWVG